MIGKQTAFINNQILYIKCCARDLFSCAHKTAIFLTWKAISFKLFFGNIICKHHLQTLLLGFLDQAVYGADMSLHGPILIQKIRKKKVSRVTNRLIRAATDIQYCLRPVCLQIFYEKMQSMKQWQGSWFHFIEIGNAFSSRRFSLTAKRFISIICSGSLTIYWLTKPNHRMAMSVSHMHPHHDFRHKLFCCLPLHFDSFVLSIYRS